jgi:hypothetical protein
MDQVSAVYTKEDSKIYYWAKEGCHDVSYFGEGVRRENRRKRFALYSEIMSPRGIFILKSLLISISCTSGCVRVSSRNGGLELLDIVGV